MNVVWHRGPGEPPNADFIVVIDVLRATSTACVLTARGIDFRVLSNADESQGFDHVFSELLEASEDQGRHDNSPTEAECFERRGSVALMTTNGTKALWSARCHGEVVLASFLNLRAVATHISGGDQIVLLPSGSFETGVAHAEDDLAARGLERLLRGEQPNYEALLTEAREKAIERRGLDRGVRFRDDLERCFRANKLDVLPILQSNSGTELWVRSHPSAKEKNLIL